VAKDAYITQLEKQNEELQHKLADVESERDYMQEQRDDAIGKFSHALTDIAHLKKKIQHLLAERVSDGFTDDFDWKNDGR
jgi:peptidoglycan hydrolase CwlO-like protein